MTRAALVILASLASCTTMSCQLGSSALSAPTDGKGRGAQQREASTGATPVGGLAAAAAERARVACAHAFAAIDPAPEVASLPSRVALPRQLVDLRPTLGRLEPAVDGWMRVLAPKMRLVAPGTADLAAIRFRYDGPTRETSRLSSGEVRRQLGIKLRAKDSCNVVYAMWRFEDTRSRLAVSVKKNPRMTRHAECDAGGYETLDASWSPDEPLPPVVPGSTHHLVASLEGERLCVYADGAVSWVGFVPIAALGFDGPTGVRSDNVAVELEFAAASRPALDAQRAAR